MSSSFTLPVDPSPTSSDANVPGTEGSVPQDREASPTGPRPTGKRRKKKRILFTILATILILALAAWQLIPRLLVSREEVVQEQRLASATRSDLTVSITGSGPLEPVGKRTIASEVDTTVTEILYKNGDTVQAGDVLMRLDPSDAETAFREAQNNLEEALSSTGTTDEALAALVMRAPHDGRVTAVLAQPEDRIAANGVMMTLTDTSLLKSTISFGASDRDALRAGQAVRLSVTGVEGYVAGTVTYVGTDNHAIGGGGQAVDVDILVENPGSLSEGQSAAVEIQTASGWLVGLAPTTLLYAQSSSIRSDSGGNVVSVSVRENQLVKKGTVLISLENDSLLTTADSNQKKLETLTDKVTSAQETLDGCEVRAPAAGIVTNINVTVGDAVKTGSALCTILDVSTMTMEIAIDELDIGTVAVGQEVTVTVDAVSETATEPIFGTVTGIAVEGTYTNGVTTFPVTLSLEADGRLRSGMNADAAILVTNKKDVLTVPIEAVTTIGNRSFVYLFGTTGASDNTTSPERNLRNEPSGYYAGTTRIPVETGDHNETTIEIRSGLSQGDQVVLPALTVSTSSTDTQETQGGGLGGLMGGMGGGMPAGDMGGMPAGGGFRPN